MVYLRTVPLVYIFIADDTFGNFLWFYFVLIELKSDPMVQQVL